ncbi:hypothetical protein BURCENBC7_AP3815 [Burkholderia cenocepacia BC7]|nr:hypothetical protein BURCENK562V_C5615 [Burkholderia cenocepacia K56-2Valvano]ERI32163.1 hypothetical protein BURCENBC7_AP3815 [Burkholderia cenocepacia BC7]
MRAVDTGVADVPVDVPASGLAPPAAARPVQRRGPRLSGYSVGQPMKDARGTGRC